MQTGSGGIQVRGITIPESELDWRFSSSGGPGGQHANTSNTAAELRLNIRASNAIPERIRERIIRRLSHRITGAGDLITSSSEHRSQTRNRDEARKRMAGLLDEGIKPPVKRRKATKPSRAARRRRVEDKRRRGKIKAERQGRDW